jgi:hypothetical protein
MKTNRGAVMKDVHPVDEEHMAAVPGTNQSVKKCSTEQPNSILCHINETAYAYELAYAEWLKAYAHQFGRTCRICLRKNDESASAIEQNWQRKKIGVIQHVFNGMKHFAFFPHTEVQIRWKPMSDGDAIFNDWVAIGSDLYSAIRKYRIDSSLGESNSIPVDSPGVTARSRAS